MSLGDLWRRLSGRSTADELIEIEANGDDLAELARALPHLSKDMIDKLGWSREQALAAADALADRAPATAGTPRAISLPEQDWKRLYRMIAILRQQGTHGWTTRVMARISAGSIKAHRWP
jgi:hypothetical protein